MALQRNKLPFSGMNCDIVCMPSMNRMSLVNILSYYCRIDKKKSMWDGADALYSASCGNLLLGHCFVKAFEHDRFQQ